jgi:hypothetical protein
MSWQIGLINNDYKILKTNKTDYYNTESVSSSNYFTITNDGRIGINKPIPLHKVDIEGDTRVNGTLHTSNIIGNIDNGSNLLRINFEGDDTLSTSNSLEIFGKTNIYGNLDIGDSTEINNLNVSGNIVANSLSGIGSNITSIHASNIKTGILPIARGGTGINFLTANNILYANNNLAIEQSSQFTFNSLSGELSVQRIRTDGQYINNINADSIRTGILPVNRGGTGAGQYDIVGGMLIGNITGTQDGFTRINQTNLLRWDNANKSLNIVGDIKIPAGNNIYVGNNILSIDTIGEYRSATFDTKGIIQLSSDFRLDEQGKVRIVNEGSSKWALNSQKHIHFPFGDDISCNYFVGIGTNPSTINNFRLDVNGDINTSNGVYKVNGVDIVAATSNTISSRITKFNLDDIASPEPINGLIPTTGGWNNKFFTRRSVISGTNEFEYFISSAPYTYDFVFDHPVIFKSNIKCACWSNCYIMISCSYIKKYIFI